MVGAGRPRADAAAVRDGLRRAYDDAPDLISLSYRFARKYLPVSAAWLNRMTDVQVGVGGGCCEHLMVEWQCCFSLRGCFSLRARSVNPTLPTAAIAVPSVAPGTGWRAPDLCNA
jgi:hypothetical protein